MLAALHPTALAACLLTAQQLPPLLCCSWVSIADQNWRRRDGAAAADCHIHRLIIFLFTMVHVNLHMGSATNPFLLKGVVDHQAEWKA